MNTPKYTNRKDMYDTVMVANQAHMTRDILNTIGQNYGNIQAVAICQTNPQTGWVRVAGWNEDDQDYGIFWVFVTSDIVEMS